MSKMTDLEKGTEETEETQETNSQPQYDITQLTNIINSAVSTHLKRELKKMKAAEPVQEVVEEKNLSELELMKREIERLKKSNTDFLKQAKEAELNAKREKATNEIRSVMGTKVPQHIQDLLVPQLLNNVNLQDNTYDYNDCTYSIKDGINNFLNSENGKKYISVERNITKSTKNPELIEGNINISNSAYKAYSALSESGLLESFMSDE